MAVSRIDLADSGSPEKLIIDLLKAEPDVQIPVPVEELALQLDIEEIVPLKTVGFEGGLITDALKSRGIILYNEASRYKRRRFTLAHELGHFLMPFHLPSNEGKFLCSLDEMYSLARNEQDRRLRMEAEANRFASLLLLPPPFFRRDATASRDPNLQEIVRLSDQYMVSKEAIGRAYIDYRDEAAALIVIRDGKILRIYKNKKFPFITAERNTPVSSLSTFRRKKSIVGASSEIDECDPTAWLELVRGKKAPTLFEQFLHQQMGYALILLHIETDADAEEDYDPEENLTARERFRHRLGR